jgi:amino acid efflux transporter
MQRTLSLPHGIGLALGSIAGSGLLFLPSLTLVVGGSDVMLVWLTATLVCLPVLFLLADVVREFDDGSGIEGLIARGLGRHVAAGVPLLFLSIVMLGIPAGALIAGTYLAEAVGGGQAVAHLTALVIVGVSAGVNLAGIRLGARVQLATATLLIAIGVALVALTSLDAAGGYDAVAPGPPDTGRLLSGVLIAFFAYAGFENLTFIASEFRNPRRDFPIAMAVAFAAYGLLAVALTANLAAIVPAGRIDEVAGLSQLAETVEPAALATGVITALALALMQVNANSWVWGMSRLVRSAASAGRLPRSLGALDGRGVPRRAVGLLSGGFLVTLGLAAFAGDLVTDLLVTASAGFVVLYLLAVLAYLRRARATGRRALAGLLLIVLVALLANDVLYALPALGVIGLSAVASLARARRYSNQTMSRIISVRPTPAPVMLSGARFCRQKPGSARDAG